MAYVAGKLLSFDLYGLCLTVAYLLLRCHQLWGEPGGKKISANKTDLPFKFTSDGEEWSQCLRRSPAETERHGRVPASPACKFVSTPFCLECTLQL